MKKYFFSLVTFLLPLLFACGDEGLGFNITKNVPVEFIIEIPANDPAVQETPPSFTETFRLADVGAFEDVLSNLAETGGVTINSITYSITEVSEEEEVTLDEIRLSVSSSSAEQLNVLGISGTLRNTPETDAGVVDSDVQMITEILTNYKEVDNTLIFYFSELPATDLNFVFTLYYDVTLRVRY